MSDDLVQRVAVRVILEAEHPFDSGQVGEGVITFDTAMSDNEVHRAIATGIARVLREIAVEVERERDDEFPLDQPAYPPMGNPDSSQVSESLPLSAYPHMMQPTRPQEAE